MMPLKRPIPSIDCDIEFKAGISGGNRDEYSNRRRGATADCWYTSASGGTALSTATLTNNVLYAMPFFVGKNSVLDRVAINITTLQAASAARLGIYADDGNNYPGALVLDAGTVPCTGTGVQTITISKYLKAGFYWLVIVTNVNSIAIRGLAVAGAAPVLGLDNTLGTAPGLGWSVAFTYAALPASYPATTTVLIAVPLPAVFVRIS